MPNFVPEKGFSRGVLPHCFNMKKSAAERHRILVEVYGGGKFMVKVVCTIQKACQPAKSTDEYPWREGNALYLVGSFTKTG